MKHFDVRLLGMKPALLFIFTLSTLFAQVPSEPEKAFTFKSASLGMSLADFKDDMKGEPVWINSGKPNFLGKLPKKMSHEVPTPLCTDRVRGFEGDPMNLKEGEVLCNPSPGDRNPNFLVVAGAELKGATYRFYNNRLYEIDLRAMPFSFNVLSTAFTQKYGPPTKKSDSQYQNAYGANWSGRNLFWYRGSQSIVLSEGSGNGPAQESADVSGHYSMAIFSDSECEPPVGKSKPLDF